MPSLYLVGKLKLSPWAGDDLHPLCILWLVIRFSQICAILGLIVILSSAKWMKIGSPFRGNTIYCNDGNNNNETMSLLIDTATTTATTTAVNDVNASYHNNTINNLTETTTNIALMYDNMTNITNTSISPADNITFREIIDFTANTLVISEKDTQDVNSSIEWLTYYTYLSMVSIIIDFALILSIWTASSIGTPTVPKLRNTLLRPLILAKTIGLLVLNCFCISIGISLVVVNRRHLSNCHEDINDLWDGDVWYDFFCIVLVFQVTELYFWVCILINRIRLLILDKLRQIFRYYNHTRELSMQRCLVVCCQCCSIITCFRLGGTKVQNITEFSDIVIAFIDFMDINNAYEIDNTNNDANDDNTAYDDNNNNDDNDDNDSSNHNKGIVVGVMFTDIYLAFKMLLRVQRQRQLECIKQYNNHHTAIQQKQIEDEEQVVVSFVEQQQHHQKQKHDESKNHSLSLGEKDENNNDDNSIYQVNSSVERDFNSFALNKEEEKEMILDNNEEDITTSEEKNNDNSIYQVNSSGVEVDFNSFTQYKEKEDITTSLKNATSSKNNGVGKCNNRRCRRNATIFKQKPNASSSLSSPSALSKIHYNTTTRSILSFSAKNGDTNNNSIEQEGHQPYLDDRIIIEDGAHFLKYANAIYGNIERYLIFEGIIDKVPNPCNLSFWYDPRSLLQKPSFFKKRIVDDDDQEEENHKDTNVDEEKAYNTDTKNNNTKKLQTNYYNFYYNNESIYLDDIELHNTELLYIQLNNSIKETPYCIVADNTTKNIVLCIRGSASLEDFVIDTQLTPMCLQHIGRKYCKSSDNGIDNIFDGELGHKGLVRRSIWIYEDIQIHGVLHNLLHNNSTNSTSKYKDYGFVISGHSLGAGCGAILALMLKSEYPSVKCYAYCPPGGLLSYKLATSCKDYVISFINGSDIIPRMSFHNLQKLRDESLVLLSRIKIPKFECYRIMKNSKNDHDAYDDANLEYWNEFMLYNDDEKSNYINTPFYKSLLKFREYQSKKNREKLLKLFEIINEEDTKTACIINTTNIEKNAKNTKLFPPGKIIYFARNDQLNEVSSTPIYADNSDFDEILITNTTIQDHSIRKNMKVFEYILHSFDNPAASTNNDKHTIEENGDDDDNNNDRIPDAVVNGVYICNATKSPKLSSSRMSILNDKKIYCCSRPHGNRILIAAMLGLIAVFMGNFGNNDCDLFYRTSISNSASNNNLLDQSLFPDIDGLNISTGLWSFEQKEFINTTTASQKLVGSGVCAYFPKWHVPDTFLQTARASGTLSWIFGLFGTVMIWFSSCVEYRNKTWRIVQSFFLLATMFQVLVIVMYLKSNLCHEYKTEENNDVDITVSFTSKCNLGRGATLCISASVLYFIAALSMIFYPTPK